MRDDTDAEPAADPLQEHMDGIERLASLVAGEDPHQFILVFQSLANLLDGFLARPAEEGTAYARSVLMRSADPHLARGTAGRRMAVATPPGPDSESINADPVFLENARTMIRDRRRIVGGIRTSDFPDCVAIGNSSRWCCSGTLVAANVVVTAGHCVAGGCAERVFVGEDVRAVEGGQVIDVETTLPHPDYQPPNPTSDLAVLILSQDANVEPRRLADSQAIQAARSVRLAGFGNTDVFSSGGYGQRRIVDVPIATADPKFGADGDTEFVAGAPFLDRDSCSGDSGGPAYVETRDGWQLAGATSRATASTFRPCGDGGIYTRVGVFEDWVRSVPGGRWG
jgi:secreted trypsin-like serine protease